MPDKVCQKLIVNMNTPMGIGRLTAQAGHASWLAVLNQSRWEEDDLVIPCQGKPWLKAWLEGMFTKVALRGWGSEHILSLQDAAIRAGIPVGLMEEDGYVTSLAVGPWDTAEIDSAIGRLNLL